MATPLGGSRVRLFALGCRTNLYEAEALAGALASHGAEIVSAPPFDAAVVVSCTVTATADKKCRQIVRRLTRQSPGALIAVCGCWAQNLGRDEARALGIHLLVGNGRKATLPRLLGDALARPREGLFREERSDPVAGGLWDGLTLERPMLHTRAFVKVQDGCDHFCSYCVIPLVRGRPVSRPAADVTDEVRRIAASGCPEIVLTGIHLGRYGRGGDVSLGQLVRAVAAVDGIKRIRFGSLEPFGVDDDLLEVLAATPAFCPHLHLALQSGSAEVLRRMRRGYGPDEYLATVERVRSALGRDTHISSDILVGFPGETEKEFADTLSLMRACAMGRVHVFPYSPRKGTDAFAMAGRVPPGIRAERTRRAIALGDELLKEYGNRWTGRTVPVLVEETGPSTFEGLSREFLRVQATGSGEQGREALVAVTAATDGTLSGCRVALDSAPSSRPVALSENLL